MQPLPPHNLANEVPWEAVQPGVARCCRGTDVIGVVVAGQLPWPEERLEGLSLEEIERVPQ